MLPHVNNTVVVHQKTNNYDINGRSYNSWVTTWCAVTYKSCTVKLI